MQWRKSIFLCIVLLVSEERKITKTEAKLDFKVIQMRCSRYDFNFWPLLLFIRKYQTVSLLALDLLFISTLSQNSENFFQSHHCDPFQNGGGSTLMFLKLACFGEMPHNHSTRHYSGRFTLTRGQIPLLKIATWIENHNCKTLHNHCKNHNTLTIKCLFM